MKNINGRYSFTGHYEQNSQKGEISGGLIFHDNNIITGSLLDKASTSPNRAIQGAAFVGKGSTRLYLICRVPDPKLLDITYVLSKPGEDSLFGEYLGVWRPLTKLLELRHQSPATRFTQSNGEDAYIMDDGVRVPLEKDMRAQPARLDLARR